MAKSTSTNGRMHAPPGGLRHKGKTYRGGQLLPAHYRKEVGRPRDPAGAVQGAAPPNFGRFAMPHVITFQGLMSTISKVYRNPDEAIKNSRENALKMRRDCFVMECLEARQRGTALLNWHLEPDDKDSPDQKELCDQLTKILQDIPRFTEYRRNLLEALWFGRYGVQHQYGFDRRYGWKRTVIKGWLPVHGDKLAFRYDDGTGEYDENQIGIRVIGHYSIGDKIAGDRKLEPTDFGLAYFLQPWERTMFAVHKHMIEDAAFEDITTAGSIHGVGIRSRIYWTWYQMQEALAMLVEYLERTGMGFTIYWYPAGNNEAQEEMRKVAYERSESNVILMPRTPGDPAMDGYGIERIEPNPAGAESLKTIVHEFFGHRIKRYILGQTLTTESQPLGLGGGAADVQYDSLLSIVEYDAANLEETITKETVEPLKNWTFPASRDICVRFKIDTESHESEKKLGAFKAAWDMGLKIKAADVYNVIGASQPTEEDETLINPSIIQQTRLWEQQHGPQAAGNQAMGASLPQEAMPGSIEDLFGPLANLGNEAAENNGDPTAPVKYKKWDESKHPRGQPENAGEFAENGGTEVPAGKANPKVKAWAAKKFKDEKKVEAFVNWFGDSKMVNDKGEPITVYHGTTAEFESFDKALVRANYQHSFGLHFTDRTSEAGIYSKGSGEGSIDPNSPFPTGSNIKPVFLKAQKPLIIETKLMTASMEADLNKAEIIHKLVRAKERGEPYDSVIIRRVRGDEWDGVNAIVFEPTQIKSATGNRGTFDAKDERITYRREGDFAPPSAPSIGGPSGSQPQHRVGETMVQNGTTYRLNENHRWQREGDDETGGDQPQGKPDQPPGQPPAPGAQQGPSLQERQHFAAKQLGSIDKHVASMFRAFHASPEYQKGGEYWTQHFAPEQAQAMHQQLVANVGKEFGGGQVVDLGDRIEGAIGFSSGAGAMVVVPPKQEGGKWRVSYTVNTGPVKRAMAGGEALPAGGQAEQQAGAAESAGEQPPQIQAPGSDVAAAMAAADPRNQPPQTQPTAQQPEPPPSVENVPAEAPRQAAPPPPPAEWFKKQHDSIADQLKQHQSNVASLARRKDELLATGDPTDKKLAGQLSRQLVAERAKLRLKQTDLKQAKEHWLGAEEGEKQAAAAKAAAAKAAPAAPEGQAATQFHQMTREQFAQAGHGRPEQHKQHLKEALGRGERISTHILKDYPELILAAARQADRKKTEAAPEQSATTPTAAATQTAAQAQPNPRAEPAPLSPEQQAQKRITDLIGSKLLDTTTKLSAGRAAPSMTNISLLRDAVSSGKIPDKETLSKVLAESRRLAEAGDTVGNFEKALKSVTEGQGPNALLGGVGDETKTSDVDPQQLKQGVKVEQEHTDEPAVAQEIAKDHLTEDPNYYDKLKRMEAQPKEPDYSATERYNIQSVLGESGGEKRLTEAGLQSHGRNQAALRRAVASGHIADSKHLNSVLKTAAKLKSRGDLKADDHDHVKEAIKRHVERQINKPDLGAIVEERAAEAQVSPKELHEAIKHVHGMRSEAVKARENSKAELRKRAGLNARRIAQMEDAGKDHSDVVGFDQIADAAKSDPDLMHLGIHDEGDLWELLKEGAQRVPARHDDEIINEALSWLKQNKGQEMSQAEREELDKIPFKKVRELWQRYTKAAENDGDTLVSTYDDLLADEAKQSTADELRDRIERAALETDAYPSPEQKEAGNYRKGKCFLHGLKIAIETPQGATRSGVDRDGKAWSITMPWHYGYVLRTESEADGDHFDLFLGPNPESEVVFVVDQLDPAGNEFDEHKALVGWTNADEAKAAYLSAYSEGWKGFGDITPMTIPAFKDWLANGDTSKPIGGQVA